MKDCDGLQMTKGPMQNIGLGEFSIFCFWTPSQCLKIGCLFGRGGVCERGLGNAADIALSVVVLNSRISADACKLLETHSFSCILDAEKNKKSGFQSLICFGLNLSGGQNW